MFVNGIGGGSILLLCLLDCIAVLRVWLSICLLGGIGGDSILRLCLLDFVVVLTVWLSICLLVVFMSNGGIIASKAKSSCNGV